MRMFYCLKVFKDSINKTESQVMLVLLGEVIVGRWALVGHCLIFSYRGLLLGVTAINLKRIILTWTIYTFTATKQTLAITITL